MNQTKLNKVLRLHKLWLYDEPGGKRAGLCGADLHGAYLRGANLRGANLCGADLCHADMRLADLRDADLRDADLRGADLCDADLRDADLRGANLCGAELRGVDLSYADLRGADLCGANLYDTNLLCAKLDGVIVDKTTKWFAMRCPAEGAYIGYKKCCGNLIVELEIPADAKRSSATTEKCRASKAKMLSITKLDGTPADVTKAVSQWDATFVYRLGETVEVKGFDEDRWNECSTGIHHFINRQEAVEY